MTTQSTNAAALDALLSASGNSGDIPLVTYNWNPSTQLANYLAAQAAVAAGVAGSQAEIVAVGDSTTLGFGTGNDYRPTVSYPADLATLLSQDGVAAQQDNFLGQGNNDFTTPDSRIALQGGAIWGYPYDAGGPVVVANNVGQGFTFTLPTPATYDRVTVDYLDSGNGVLDVATNGGAVLAALQLGNTGTMMSQTVDLPAGSYASVTVTSGSTAPTDIEGVSFWDSTIPAVQVFNAGVGGAESSIVGDGVTPGPGDITGAAALGANLALINFGINDILQGNLTAAQTTANIALMVNEFRADGTDPIIIIPQPLTAATYAGEIATLRADIYQLATTLNVPVIDLSATYGDNAAALVSNGLLTSDGTHPSPTLYADIASGIATLLTSATGTLPAPVTQTPVTSTPVTPVPTSSTPSLSTPSSSTPSSSTPSSSTPSSSTPDPTPVPSSSPTPETIGVGPDSLVLDISEDAYLGNALFTVSVDGTQIGGTQTATAIHGQGQEQVFTVDGTFASGQTIVTVDFLNDAYGGTASSDRNLYVDNITMGGVTQDIGAALLSQGPQSFTVGTAPLDPAPVDPAPVDPAPVDPAPVSSGGTASTTTTSSDTGAITIGSGPDTLALQVSEDAYLGDAQFTVAVNGTQIGGVQTATASHAAGATQTFDVMGTFSGQSAATVTFLNDAYSGTPETDRNLYVTGASIDGTPITGSALTEDSAGPMSFLFQDPGSSAASGGGSSSPVVLDLAEDAYLGDAKFTVSIDGGAASAPQTVTAPNALGQSQMFSLGDLAAGAHDIAVSFVNDLYAGTPSTDRNLYVTGIDVGGTLAPNTQAAILGDWTTHFLVVVPS
jgi:lysophospholipase L1-like esterase